MKDLEFTLFQKIIMWVFAIILMALPLIVITTIIGILWFAAHCFRFVS